MTIAAIETRNLRKTFGNKVAVDNLTLNVEQGEVFGFLGPNGAGKTTSVKILLNLVSPTSGEGFLFGAPLKDTKIRSQIGFLPEHFRFHDWLTAHEFLNLHADLYHMPRHEAHHRISDLLELVGLMSFTNQKLREFSKGMLQRIGLAQALLNRPKLVILDEPTSGLDPVGRRLVRDIIKDLRQEGTSVFLNSHLLSEIEITCDRVAFIKHGEVIRTSAVDKLIKGELSIEILASGINSDTVTGLENWCDDIRIDGEHLMMTVRMETDIPLINRYLVEHGADVYALRPQHISLEDVFIQVIGTDGGL